MWRDVRALPAALSTTIFVDQTNVIGTHDGTAAHPYTTIQQGVDAGMNGDWEGKFGLWFNLATYQYRSAHDYRLGQRFLPGPHDGGEAA